MDSVTALLTRARGAGLRVWAERGRLEVRGPCAAAADAEELLGRKAEVLAEFAAERERRQRTAPLALLPDGADPDHPPRGWFYVRSGPLRQCWIGPSGELDSGASAVKEAPNPGPCRA